MELLKRSRFLPKNVLMKLYFNLPSIIWPFLWGSCCNSDLSNSIERLHCSYRAARIQF